MKQDFTGGQTKTARVESAVVGQEGNAFLPEFFQLEAAEAIFSLTYIHHSVLLLSDANRKLKARYCGNIVL